MLNRYAAGVSRVELSLSCKGKKFYLSKVLLLVSCPLYAAYRICDAYFHLLLFLFVKLQILNIMLNIKNNAVGIERIK